MERRTGVNGCQSMRTVMPGQIVFVRFFLGFADSFQFDRFLRLRDDEIGGAVDALKAKWWRDPSNRRRFQASQKKVLENKRKWLGHMDVKLPTAQVRITTRAPVPSFKDIAVMAGWRLVNIGDNHGITCRYPVARFRSKKGADSAAAALQARVAELARSTESKTHWINEDFWLSNAQPRFYAISEAELPPAERIVVTEKLERLSQTPGPNSCLEEAILRGLYLAKIADTLQHTLKRSNSAKGSQKVTANHLRRSNRFGLLARSGKSDFTGRKHRTPRNAFNALPGWPNFSRRLTVG